MLIDLAELCAAFHAEFCAVRKLCAAVGAEGGLGGRFGGLFAAAVGAEGHVRAVGRAAGARPAALGGLGSGLLAAAAGAEARRPPAWSPAAAADVGCPGWRRRRLPRRSSGTAGRRC